MSETITILHLSDLHYDGSKTGDVEIILDALWRDLKNFPAIDMILFSGDLVKIGDNGNDFQAAEEKFIRPLLKKTGLSPNRFFPVPGNHDIQRSRIDDIIEEGLKQKLQSREEINVFLDNELKNGFSRIERLDNFNRFKEPYGADYRVNTNKLFSTYTVPMGSAEIGIACLNSSWRATGRGDNSDHGRLIIGDRQIDHAARDLDQCDLKLAVFHHPLDWLAESDQLNSERKISRKFDFLFCGHLHKSNIKLVQWFDNKSVLVQGGALYRGREFLNCYSVITLNLAMNNGYVRLRSYFDDREEFDKAVNLVKDGEYSVVLKNNGKENANATVPTGATPGERPEHDKEKGFKLFEKRSITKNGPTGDMLV